MGQDDFVLDFTQEKGPESCLILLSSFQLWQEETDIRDKNEKHEKKIKFLRKARCTVRLQASLKEVRVKTGEC